MKPILPAPIFALLAAVFLTLAFLDWKRRGSHATPARRTWFRIGLIFTGISLYLIFFQGHFQ
jgi:hypothetical protein